MSGRALDRMRELLNGVGAYRLTGSSSADWELNACGAGFSLIEDGVESLLNDLFPDTASSDRLDLWERSCGLMPSAGTLEQRRAILAARLAMNPQKLTGKDFSAMLPAAGVVGEVVEGESSVTVLAGRLLGVSQEEAKAELDVVMPAHLSWTWDDSVNWAALDAWAEDFATLDARALTWEDLDGVTGEKLEEWNRPIPELEPEEPEPPEILEQEEC